MRRTTAAVVALLVTMVVGLVVVLASAGSHSGGFQFSNAVVVSGFGDQVPAGAQLCTGPIGRTGGFDHIRFSLASRLTDPARAATPRLRVSVLDRAGARLSGPVTAALTPADVARDFADVHMSKLPAGSPIRVCIANQGTSAVRLWSGGAAVERAGRTTIDGQAAPTVPELQFFTSPTPSLLARVPTMFHRATLWHPDWLGTWSLWVLAVLVVLGVPALLVLALLRAGGDGEDERGGGDDPPERWQRFQAEVEPTLAAEPRVHRFAAEPIVGDGSTAARSLVVALVGDEAAAGATRASLEASTVSADAVTLAPTPDEALRAANGEHVVLVAAGDTLAPLALERLGQALTLAPDVRLVTCDFDHLDGETRSDPRVHPGPSPDLLLARDVAGAALCVRRTDALAALDAAPLEPTAWRYDLALRLAGADAAGHAHVPLLLVHRAAPVAPASAAERRVVERALATRGAEGAHVEDVAPGRRRVRWGLARRPTVEAIVLFRDKPALLRRCVTSLLERSTYEHLSVRLVDNGSVEAETASLVAELSRDPRVVAMRDPQPFNFAALNNVAAAASEAEVVVFLNNDTEVITADWVEGLLEEALRPEVGAVAPLLLYPGGTVQHVGAALGMHGYAGHPFAGLRPETETPFGSALDGTRDWLAVTAACMMVERAKLDAVGGFDESFVVAGNDVDLCLRLTAAGHRSLCVPHVRMLHDESQSRGAHIDPGDFARSEQVYGAFRTVGDPFYSPLLTLRDSTCALRAAGE